jgi:RNA polymerase sigma factor (sigma-70 family)
MEWTTADRERLTEWLERAHGQLLRSVQRLGVPPRDAEDVIQDALIGVIERWKEFETFDKFLAYCLTRARWRAFDAWKKRPRERLESDLSENERARVLGHPDPQDAEATLREHEMMDAVQQLPARSREVILLSASGMNSFEIAKRLGIEPTSVRSLLRHARYRIALGWKE